MMAIRILCCLLGLVAGGALAQAGYVKTVSGQAHIVSAGVATPAQPGAPVNMGDTVQTGSDGAIGITLKDNTLLSFGPSTAFKLEEFLFEPASNRMQLAGNIASGSLHMISGTIARLKPQAVQIKTPSGIVGVRGTRFVVVVQE